LWWTHERLGAGESRSGWIAGDVHTVYCHCSKRSKPCLKHLLGSRTECPGCDAEMSVKPLGYLPLWRYDGKGVVVVLRDHQFEPVGKLKLHTYVTYSRLKGAGESIQVAENPAQRIWETTLPEKRKAVDLCRWLCVMWQLPHVEAALRESMLPSVNEMSQPTRLNATQAAELLEKAEDEHRAVSRDVLKRTFVVPDHAEKPIAECFPALNGRAKGRK